MKSDDCSEDEEPKKAAPKRNNKKNAEPSKEVGPNCWLLYLISWLIHFLILFVKAPKRGKKATAAAKPAKEQPEKEDSKVGAAASTRSQELFNYRKKYLFEINQEHSEESGEEQPAQAKKTAPKRGKKTAEGPAAEVRTNFNSKQGRVRPFVFRWQLKTFEVNGYNYFYDVEWIAGQWWQRFRGRWRDRQAYGRQKGQESGSEEGIRFQEGFSAAGRWALVTFILSEMHIPIFVWFQTRALYWNSKSWSVFKRNAVNVQSVFLQHFPDLEVEFNSTAPRRGSFELVVTNSDGIGMDFTSIFENCSSMQRLDPISIAGLHFNM